MARTSNTKLERVTADETPFKVLMLNPRETRTWSVTLQLSPGLIVAKFAASSLRPAFLSNRPASSQKALMIK